MLKAYEENMVNTTENSIAYQKVQYMCIGNLLCHTLYMYQ